MTPVSLFSTP